MKLLGWSGNSTGTLYHMRTCQTRTQQCIFTRVLEVYVLGEPILCFFHAKKALVNCIGPSCDLKKTFRHNVKSSVMLK